MAKKMYIGVDDIARKVKKGYVGIDGVARKIKKGYIGVGGVARPFFGGGELVYYGLAEPFTKGTANMAATTVGDYALFGGGFTGNNISNIVSTVYAYDIDLVKSTPTGLSQARRYLTATTVGNYALFGGGDYYASNGAPIFSDRMDTYDPDLTRSTAAALSSARWRLSSAAAGNHALFFGGYGDVSTPTNKVDVYDTELTKSIAPDLSYPAANLDAATVGNYVLIAGLSDGIVDVYDKELIKSTAENLSDARYQMAAASVGDYALFGGGLRGTNSTSNYKTAVDVYDSDLVKVTVAELPDPRYDMAAASVGGYAIFHGGHYISQYDLCDTVYDSSLVQSLYFPPDNIIQYEMAAATVGDYALFGGGRKGAYSYLDMVQAYTIV